MGEVNNMEISKNYIEIYNEFINSDITIYPKWVRLFIERQKKDLKKRKFIFSFNTVKPSKVCKFIELLEHSKGIKSGNSFIMEPWQIFIIFVLFGWISKETGSRRYKTALLSIPRKNGKTAFVSAISSYLSLEESNSEIIYCANSKEQAEILFRQTKEYLKTNKYFKDYFKLGSLLITNSVGGRIFPIHSDSERLDGLSPSCVVYDEFFASENDKLYNVLRSSFGARKNPLFLIIGSHTEKVFSDSKKLEDYIKKILEGKEENDTVMGVIYEPDETDSVDDEATWKKVNPNLGVSITLEEFRNLYNEAKSSPSKWQNFLAKNLNKWINEVSINSWLPNEKISAVMEVVKETELYNKEVFIAYDLSKRGDLTALSFLISRENKNPIILNRAFIPETTLDYRIKNENASYHEWISKGTVIPISGDYIDLSVIEEYVENLVEKFSWKVREHIFDKWGSKEIVDSIEKSGGICVDFPQWGKFLGPAIKNLEEAILKKNISIEASSLTLWNFQNVIIKYDKYGQPLFKKEYDGSKKKIDCAITTLMSYARYRNFYNNKNLLIAPVENLDKKSLYSLKNKPFLFL